MMVVCCLLTMLSYIMPIGIAMAVVEHPTDLQPGSFTTVADSLGYGGWIGNLMLVGGVFANVASFNAFLYTASQALFTMSEEGKAPSFFSISKRYSNTPFISILFIAAVTIGLLFLDFDLVVQIQGILYSLHIVVVVTALLRLRKKFPERDRPFRIPTPWPFTNKFPDLGAYLVALLPLSVVGFTLYYSEPIYLGCCLAALTAVGCFYWIQRWLCPPFRNFQLSESRGISYASTGTSGSESEGQDDSEGQDTGPASNSSSRRPARRLPPVFPLTSTQVRNLYMHVPIPELAAAQNILERRQRRGRRRRRKRRANTNGNATTV